LKSKTAKKRWRVTILPPQKPISEIQKETSKKGSPFLGHEAAPQADRQTTGEPWGTSTPLRVEKSDFTYVSVLGKKHIEPGYIEVPQGSPQICEATSQAGSGHVDGEPFEKGDDGERRFLQDRETTGQHSHEPDLAGLAEFLKEYGRENGYPEVLLSACSSLAQGEANWSKFIEMQPSRLQEIFDRLG